jgi:DNA-binding transcriptional LysR family regulator
VLRITERIQIELLLGLIRGELDFIIAQTEWYGFIEGLKQRVLFRDRLHVIARPGHPALALEKVTWPGAGRVSVGDPDGRSAPHPAGEGAGFRRSSRCLAA